MFLEIRLLWEWQPETWNKALYSISAWCSLFLAAYYLAKELPCQPQMAKPHWTQTLNNQITQGGEGSAKHTLAGRFPHGNNLEDL